MTTPKAITQQLNRSLLSTLRAAQGECLWVYNAVTGTRARHDVHEDSQGFYIRPTQRGMWLGLTLYVSIVEIPVHASLPTVPNYAEACIILLPGGLSVTA